MLGLSRKTHRFFIEPLSETQHIIFNLYNRFLRFTQNISNSTKTPLRNLFNAVKKDCRSTTGYNLRKFMLRFKVSIPDEVNTDIIKRAVYNDVPYSEEWKLIIAKELIEITRKKRSLPRFDREEITSLLEYVTT